MNTPRLISMATALVLAYAPIALAEGTATAIAVVNNEQIMRDSAVGKSVREQLEGKYKSFQSDVTKKEDEFQKEGQELGKQQSVLAKKAFEDKATAFRKKVDEAQREAKTRKALLDNAMARAWTEVQKTASDIVADIAKEKGFVIVIAGEGPTSQVLYADPKIDITNEVMTRLNQKLPKLDVKFDAPAADAKKPADAAPAPDKK